MNRPYGCAATIHPVRYSSKGLSPLNMTGFILDELVKSRSMVLQMQGAQKLRREAHLRVRRNDEVEAQRSGWTFYETIISLPERPCQ